MTPMKKIRALICEIVRHLLLSEDTCPECGDQDAYIGLNDIECPNRRCKYFKRNMRDLASDLRVLLDYAGLYGLDTEGDDVTFDAIEVLEHEHGFKSMSDNGVGTADVVSPKHWRVVKSPSDAANDADVLEAGCYDIIYWEAVSPEAKDLARKANANPWFNDEIELYDDNNDIRKLKRAHVWQIQTEKPPQPFDGQTIDDLLGVGHP